MKDNINETRNQLIKKLDILVENTEILYLDLGKGFPLLLNELDKSIKNSSSAVDSLKSAGGSFESIDLIIDEGNLIVDNFDKVFTAMLSRDGELFEIIKHGVNEMISLETIINNIKEGSIEMELISLNAMTVALKSGSAGKAFSFITDELKKLSAQTINLTDELTLNGKRQLKLFEDFGAKIEITRKIQDKLGKDIDNHLKSSFIALSKGLKESANMMESISGSSIEVKAPLMRVMQEIQLQDIIRQSIDHIYISIDGFNSFNSNWSNEDKLDELSFRKMLPDLCFSVLDEVKNSIRDSCTIFEDNSLKVKNILDDLESRRVMFVESTLKESTSDSFSIIGLKEESSKKINTLIKEVNNSIRLRLEISKDGLELLKDISILKRQFESFEPIITRFHNIIIASKIEVVKQVALKDMTDTVTKMTDLTDSIREDISNALETIKHFLKTTENVINNYSNIINREMPELQNLLSRTTENQGRLGDLTDILINCLKDFRLYTNKFLTLFNSTDENKEKLALLPVQIDDIESILRKISGETDTEMNLLLEDSNIKNWTIHSDRLNSIIEKFTIFTHKITASDLAGSSVKDEETVDSGEVTLF